MIHFECEFVALTGRAARGFAVPGKARGPGGGRVQAGLSALDPVLGYMATVDVPDRHERGDGREG